MTIPTFDEFEVRLALIHACDALGSQAEFARRHGISESHVGNVIRGQMPLGIKVPKALGFAKVTRYARKTPITSGESPRAQAGLVPNNLTPKHP